MSAKWPERFERIAGDLPESGMLAPADEVPYDTVKPASQGYVDRDGVRIWYALWGTEGPFAAYRRSAGKPALGTLMLQFNWLLQPVAPFIANERGRATHPAFAGWARSCSLSPLGNIGQHSNHPAVIEAREKIKQYGAAAAGKLISLICSP